LSNEEQRRIVLFDMDSTLVKITAAHNKALSIALAQVYGIQYVWDPRRNESQGDTQANIIRGLCRLQGLQSDVIEAGLAEAMRIKQEATLASLAADLRPAVLPGVLPVVSALKEQGHVLGLVSGSVSAVVRAVLERSGLQPYFPVCACGDEGVQRLDLLHLVLERAARAYGIQPSAYALTVVGDSARDILTGKEVNARTVAVATGFHSLEELARCHPDALFASLGDWRAALTAVVGKSQG